MSSTTLPITQGFFVSIGRYVCFSYKILYTTISRPPSWRHIREQLYTMGVMSLSVVSLTGVSTGLVLAAQAFYQLSDKGLSSITGVLVSTAMLTELGPILTAFMVTGRVGASITAELGTMRVSEQIKALQTMGVDPYKYLLAPRMIAAMIMFPLLTIYSIMMGVAGGYFISIYLFHMAPAAYFDPIPLYIDYFDIFIGMIKSLIFSIIIITVACYKGIETRGGASGVGRSTTSAVVISYVIILFVNFFLTLSLHLLHSIINQGLSA